MNKTLAVFVITLAMAYQCVAQSIIPEWVAVDKSKDGADLLFRNGTLVNQGDFIVAIFKLSNDNNTLLIGVAPQYCPQNKGVIEATDLANKAYSENWVRGGTHLFDRIAVFLCDSGRSLPVQQPDIDLHDHNDSTGT